MLHRHVTLQSTERARLRVGADVHATAEHILDVDLVSRANTAFAAANAGEGSVATTFLHQREPSPAPAADNAGGGTATASIIRRERSPGPEADAAGGGARATLRRRRVPSASSLVVHAGASSHPTSPPRSLSHIPAFRAANYNVTRSMGSRIGWTDVDSVLLCRAFLEARGGPVMATGPSNDELWAIFHRRRADLRTEQGPLRAKRKLSALEKQFKNLRNGASTSPSHYLAVK